MNRLLLNFPKRFPVSHSKVFYTTRVYTETQEWFMQENNHVKVGLSKDAINQLNDLVFIDDDVDYDQVFQKGDPICTIESVKAVAEIMTPVKGKIIELNEDIIDNLDEINKNPEDPNNWIVKLAEVS